MRRVVKRGVERIQLNWLEKDCECARIRYLTRETGDQDHAGVGIFRDDVSTGGRAVQLGHLVIHQHDVGLMPSVGLDRFQSGGNDFNDFVLTTPDELGQGSANTPFVVRDQDAHDR